MAYDQQWSTTVWLGSKWHKLHLISMIHTFGITEMNNKGLRAGEVYLGSKRRVWGSEGEKWSGSFLWDEAYMITWIHFNLFLPNSHRQKVTFTYCNHALNSSQSMISKSRMMVMSIMLGYVSKSRMNLKYIRKFISLGITFS